MTPLRQVISVAIAAATLTLGSTFPAVAAETTPPPASTNYVALGDGVTAGIGLDPSQTYPALLDAASRSLTGANLARGGAVTTTRIAGQISDFEADNPGGMESVRKVTLTVGAQDIAFRHIVNGCLMIGDCSKDFTELMNGYLADVPTKMADTISLVHESFPNAQIYVSGYYEIFGNLRRPCAVTADVSITPASAGFLNSLSRQLNSAIRRGVNTARENGVAVRYVDVASVFDGHGLCDSMRPWVFGFNELNDAKATNPTLEGQRVYQIMFALAGVR